MQMNMYWLLAFNSWNVFIEISKNCEEDHIIQRLCKIYAHNSIVI